MAKIEARTTSSMDDPLSIELNRVIADSAITIHFQPIVDADGGTILGWEALSRGPSDSPLHSPLVLFELAANFNRLIELETLALKKAVTRFKELNLPGQLFLNVTVDSLIYSSERHQQIALELSALGISTNRIVIELTETRAASDPRALEKGLAGLRALGFVMAIDDLGEGFASLKRWAMMRPDFVKIDRHFIDGLHCDPIKQQFVRSIVDMAKGTGCTIIGEGVEEEADLRCLRQQGVNFIQGYLITHPSNEPRNEIKASVAKMLVETQIINSASQKKQALRGSVIGARNLAFSAITVTSDITCAATITMFNSNVHLNSLPVLDEEKRVIGVLRSTDTLRHGTENFFFEVYGRRSCTVIMDPNPLVFDVSATLRTMSEGVANLNDRRLVDGYIVTEDGRYFGSGRMTDLLKAVSDMQISSARYANPLTLLPGNVPIDEHIKECLSRQILFVVAYFDLDYFKAFNDEYGYRLGDDVIQLAASVLAEVINPDVDFLGHIGGDDYVVVFSSMDWEKKVQNTLKQFDLAVRPFFTAEHLAARGFITQNRQNVEVFHPLVGISAGVVVVEPGTIESPAELSHRLAETKKLAKKMSGSSYFVDRRGIR